MANPELSSISTSLFKHANDLAKSLNHLTECSFKQIISYDLDCGILPDFISGYQSCATATGFIKAIETEDESSHRNKPALYWFEITSDHTANEIYESVIQLKKNTNRNLPAHHQVLKDANSNVLYLGKVKSNLAGRMLLHLGYNRSASPQGLQLCHWINRVGLKLKLNVIYLPENLAVLASVFEVELANDLNPILGKHK
ncbi:hypothetical protein [Pedobacter sp. MC2016-24]|uniref:hypothetical protein n=1 Tax=Pedobacter sp. MC2016-24 TaxID=2780090 RepID=UPI0018828668|nr:hypothetical protein [Pedobacter sp. MC2016-24]MBE9602785.1 hypothetical protein [Pedobacter sp. MC2016-24]